MGELFAYRKQPLKGLYLTFRTLDTLFIRLPFWILIYTPKYWRPRPSWTLKRCIMAKILRTLSGITLQTGILRPLPNHRAITGGPDVKAAWVDPVPQELITGSLKTWASIAGVEAIRIPGYWIDKPGQQERTLTIQPPSPGEKVLYCLHGGGYTDLSAHPDNVVSSIAKALVQHCSKSVHRAFSIEYRLSSFSPYDIANPFPTALIDALAGYYYLVNTVGFEPSDIIIEGDSAGGNLALALTRYLVENKSESLPAPPSSVILLSPWADLGRSHDGPSASTTVFTMDYLRAPRIQWAATAFVGIHGMGSADINRYISPASLHPNANARFEGFPRTFVVAGGAEKLYDSIVTLKEKMVKDMGEGSGDGQVTYYEAPDAIHDYLIFPWHEPERGDTLRTISKWIDF